ncbi:MULTISPECIES: hypothetical protein [unclassified Spirosoma]|uniref:hypothetical protein n=1 Tax=unclassified Spirosoma TaxID=2621999 RepID=UPI000B1AE377|nr:MULTISPECIES: hypothetical protein [unclassified Spirosoma]MBN8823990.1 hypothetical protein [Spirosoma sp.]
MQDPRHPDTLVAELSELNRLLANHRQMLAKHPSDSLLALSLKQYELRRTQLLKELHLSLSVFFTEQTH